MTHNTKYEVWAECDQHQEPDASEDPRYDCVGKSSCMSHPLAVWSSPVWDVQEWTYVFCQGCTVFQAEQEEWECTHERGSTLDDDWITLCKAVPPRTYCLECSEADGDGEWVQHQEAVGDGRATLDM